MRLWLALVVAQAVMPADAGERTAVVAPDPVLAHSDNPADDAATAARDEYLRLSSRLLFIQNSWGDASLIGSGLGFLAVRTVFARGFELQTALWGLGSAGVAMWQLYQRKHHPPPNGTVDMWAQLEHDARSDRRIDGGIDLALLVLSLVAWRLLRGARWRGMAAGIALQCGFLAVFNLLGSLAFGT